MKTENNEFLTVCMFAELIGVHPNSVRTMIKKGRLSAFKVGGGVTSSYRIPRSEIHRLCIVDLEKITENIVDQKLKKKNEK